LAHGGVWAMVERTRRQPSHGCRLSHVRKQAVSSMSKRVALGVLTLAGLVLAGIGLWFSSHLGAAGSGTFSAKPGGERVVVIEPSVLNRVDGPVTVTATAKDGGEVWLGRAAPSDAHALVGQAGQDAVTGVSVGGWELTTEPHGTGTAPALAQSDVWRDTTQGKGTASLTVHQSDAPETVVVATASGKPADLASVDLTWEGQAWAVKALAVLVLGVLLAGAGAAGLWLLRPRQTTTTQEARA